MEEPNEKMSPEECCGDWKKCAEGWSDQAQKLVRDEPAKAVGLALFGGVLLTVLPLGRILGALIRLAFALLRPVLLVAGVAKLYDELTTRKPKI